MTELSLLLTQELLSLVSAVICHLQCIDLGFASELAESFSANPVLPAAVDLLNLVAVPAEKHRTQPDSFAMLELVLVAE